MHDTSEFMLYYRLLYRADLIKSARLVCKAILDHGFTFCPNFGLAPTKLKPQI